MTDIFVIQGNIENGLGGMEVILGVFDSYELADKSLKSRNVEYDKDYQCYLINESHMTVSIIKYPLNVITLPTR